MKRKKACPGDFVDEPGQARACIRREEPSRSAHRGGSVAEPSADAFNKETREEHEPDGRSLRDLRGSCHRRSGCRLRGKGDSGNHKSWRGTWAKRWVLQLLSHS